MQRRKVQLKHVIRHGILVTGALLMMLPLLIVFLTSTHQAGDIHSGGLQYSLGPAFGDNYRAVLLDRSGFTKSINGMTMLGNSLVLGLGFALGKIAVSMVAAYALVFFRIRGASLIFWLIFTTLLLPLEVRILPTYEAVHHMGLANTYTGLILPLIASATGTFYFRQFFQSVPDELLDAARMDGAGPFRFFVDILLPISQTMIAALFIIMFVVGWNQYLWPTLITTEEGFFTLVRGIKQILQVWIGSNIPEYGQAMALTLLALLPPALVVIVFQSWFVKGLTESEK